MGIQESLQNLKWNCQSLLDATYFAKKNIASKYDHFKGAVPFIFQQQNYLDQPRLAM